ncbi:MAG: hypothetical protein MJZ60_09555 [Bacteroidaceae bacterium]|nr:hypothetical protein [Bacteroidaceae bacterium]
MQNFRRKLLWLSVLALFVAFVTFLCFCFVHLDNEDPRMLDYQLSYHQSFHKKTSVRDCPGCHPFLWRFNHRWDDLCKKWLGKK